MIVETFKHLFQELAGQKTFALATDLDIPQFSCKVY